MCNDINRALECECYLSALSLALTLPDICGKALYSEEASTKKRYISWYDEWIGQYEKNPSDKKEQMPYLSGEVVYQLRCSFLHEGNPNIDKDKIKEERNKIDKFVLKIRKIRTPIDIGVDTSVVITNPYIKERNHIVQYDVDIHRLCFLLTQCALKCYEKEKDKFNFFNYKIQDMDKIFSDFFKTNEKQ